MLLWRFKLFFFVMNIISDISSFGNQLINYVWKKLLFYIFDYRAWLSISVIFLFCEYSIFYILFYILYSVNIKVFNFVLDIWIAIIINWLSFVSFCLRVFFSRTLRNHVIKNVFKNFYYILKLYIFYERKTFDDMYFMLFLQINPLILLYYEYNYMNVYSLIMQW